MSNKSEYNEILRTKIGGFLKDIRKTKGLKQKDIVGVTRQTIAKIESGIDTYSVDNLFTYMRTLQVHIELSELTADNNIHTMGGAEPPSPN